MTRPRVLVTRRLPAAAIRLLESACDVDLHEGREALSHAELVSRVGGVHGLVALVTDVIDREVLEAAESLAIVANVAVGLNNIDLETAHQRGIVVTNTPGVLADATADLTWALILGITRRIVEGDRLIRAGGWTGWSFDFMLGSDLRGKQLGIVGMGSTGRAVAARAPAFGMRVAYTARTPRTIEGAEPMPFDRLLATSDVVSLHCPLTPDTTRLLDQAAFARMKRSAYLINAARGPVVDTAALVWALRNHLIAGAALDVYDDEPHVPPDLLGFENLVLVPHLGSATIETRTAMADLAARNVLAVLAGQPPITPV